jgi:hypothetical protein
MTGPSRTSRSAEPGRANAEGLPFGSRSTTAGPNSCSAQFHAISHAIRTMRSEAGSHTRACSLTPPLLVLLECGV